MLVKKNCEKKYKSMNKSVSKIILNETRKRPKK